MPHQNTKMGQSDGTKNVLMADIAAQAGVSVSTVSRVISGKSKGTSKKSRMIMNLVSQNGYEINRHAQMLRATPNSTRTGLSVDLSANFNGPLSGGITDEILRQTRRYFPNMDIFLRNSADQICGEATKLAAVEKLDVDACAAGSVRNAQVALRLKAATDRANDHENGNVLLDLSHALRQAAQHLIGCGARSILFVGQDGCPYHTTLGGDRAPIIASFPSYCDFQQITLQTVPSVGRVGRIDTSSVPQDIDGIIAGSAAAAFVMMAQLDEMGLKTPEDVKIVVMEEIGLFALTKPGLTSMSFELDRAISLMLDLFSQKLNGLNPRSELLQARLTRRASTGFVAHREI
jgi:LacI family transcriptional regulator